MTSERDTQDDPFYGLGYLTPEEAEDAHVKKLRRQYIPRVRAPRRQPRPDSNTYRHESDRDLEEIPTMSEVREARELPPPDQTHIIAARKAVEQTQYEADLSASGGDETLANALRRARADRRARTLPSS